MIAAARASLRVAVLAVSLAAGATPALPADITVAVIGPLSGSSAYTGLSQQQGTQFAISEINRTGGLLGRQLREVDLDDLCDGDRAEEGAQRALAERPTVVIGPVCSATAIRSAPLYARAGIVQLLSNSTNPRLTEMGLPTVFRMIGRDDREGEAAAQLIAKRWPRARIGIVDDQSLYGRGLADTVREALSARGFSIALNRSFLPNAGGYPDLVEAIKTAEIAVLYIGGYGGDIGRILLDLAGAGLTLHTLTGDTGAGEPIHALAGKAADGLLFTNNRDFPRERSAEPVLRDARTRGVDLNDNGLLSYTLMRVWADAVRRSGSFVAANVAAELRKGSYDTPLGTVSFDLKGDVVGPVGQWVWYVWQDGAVRDFNP